MYPVQVADALEAGIAQDEWLLYAARPIEVRTSHSRSDGRFRVCGWQVRTLWAQQRLKLVYEHGVCPDELLINESKWALDFRVGPQAMRKKMVRPELEPAL